MLEKTMTRKRSSPLEIDPLVNRERATATATTLLLFPSSLESRISGPQSVVVVPIYIA